ncbi:hypothetical protein [Natrinema salaciae]|nr:hypothetical protein [Natrinema salaciae]
MRSATDGFGPFCGALGCTEDATVVIHHSERGELCACDGCAESHEVVRDV